MYTLVDRLLRRSLNYHARLTRAPLFRFSPRVDAVYTSLQFLFNTHNDKNKTRARTLALEISNQRLGKRRSLLAGMQRLAERFSANEHTIEKDAVEREESIKR